MAIQKIYVFLATGAHPSSPTLTALQIVLGSLGLLPPTILMGITLPVLARKLTDLKESLGRSVGLLYGANTFGAALGAIITGYVLLPTLGVIQTTLLAVGLNLAAALMGLQLQKRLTPTGSLPVPGTAMNEAQESGEFRAGLTAVIILFVGGILTLALEIVYVHLLAIVVGNSAYAFSLMLFTFLIGLSLGSVGARRLIRIGVSDTPFSGRRRISPGDGSAGGSLYVVPDTGLFCLFSRLSTCQHVYGQRDCPGHRFLLGNGSSDVVYWGGTILLRWNSSGGHFPRKKLPLLDGQRR